MKLTKQQLNLMIQLQVKENILTLKLDKAMLNLLLIKNKSRKYLTLNYYSKEDIKVSCDMSVLIEDFPVLIQMTEDSHTPLQLLYDVNVSINIPLTSILEYINQQIEDITQLLISLMAAALTLKLLDYLKLETKKISTDDDYDYYQLLYLQDSKKLEDQIYRSLKNNEKLTNYSYFTKVLK